MTINFAGSGRTYWMGWVEVTPSVETHRCVSGYLRPQPGSPPGESVCERLAVASGLPLAIILKASEKVVGGYAHVKV